MGNSPFSHYNDIPDLDSDSSHSNEPLGKSSSSFYSSKKSTKTLSYTNASSPSKPLFHYNSFMLQKLQNLSDGSFSLSKEMMQCFFLPHQSEQREKLFKFLNNLFIENNITNDKVQGSVFINSLKESSLHFCDLAALKKYIEQTELDEKLLARLEKEITHYFL